jgi:signal peptidase I
VAAIKHREDLAANEAAHAPAAAKGGTMTTQPETPAPPSPWLGVWLRPRATISDILARDPRRHVLLLAAIGGIATVVIQLFLAGHRTELLVWPVIAAVAGGGALLGIVGLYLNGLMFRWSGRLLGGRATQTQLRAVMAWARLPSIVSLAICVLALLWLAYVANGSAPRVVIPVLQAIIVALGIWSLVIALLMLARAQGFGFWRTIGSAAIAGCFVLAALAVPLMVRSFLYQPFDMPSGSQMPTLLVGDYFFVSKYAYGYTHYSLPFSPRLFSGRIFGAQPQRGDLVVFRVSRDNLDYIKRIVGLPGDRVQMIGGVLNINGEPVKRERIDDFVTDEDGAVKRVRRYRETLPNGVSYDTLDLVDNGFYDNTQVYTVPSDHYFMMGDNRDNSVDSRMLKAIGYVPLENIIGRASVIFYSADSTSRSGASRVRLERIGLMLH